MQEQLELQEVQQADQLQHVEQQRRKVKYYHIKKQNREKVQKLIAKFKSGEWQNDPMDFLVQVDELLEKPLFYRDYVKMLHLLQKPSAVFFNRCNSKLEKIRCFTITSRGDILIR